MRGRSRTELESDRLFSLAMTRLLEIIGEAANRVPSEERGRYPDIDWTHIIGMKSRIIHGYDVVDLAVVWDTVAEDLPPLVAALERILAEAK